MQRSPFAALWASARRGSHFSAKIVIACAALTIALATAAIWVPGVWEPTPSRDPPVAAPAAPAASRPTQPGRVPVAYPDFGYGMGTQSPTKDKPQSKLFYQAGAWWGLLVNPATSDVRIFELVANHAWRDTSAVVDDRVDSTADALWDGQRLHVVSRTGTGEVRFLTFTFDPGARTYRPDQAAPTVLATGGAKSSSVAVDGLGRPWATFMQGGGMLVTHAVGALGGSWSIPVAPAGDESLATTDDISSIAAIPGGIVAMWSNQRTGAFYAVARKDGDPLQSWQPVETPLSGKKMADGHISLTVGPEGTLFAAVKTSLDDVANGPGRSPLLFVLARRPDGAWSSHVAATVADGVTRAEITVADAQRRLYLTFSAPSGGGQLYYKVASTERVQFVAGRGAPLTNVPGAQINNVTGTKQSVDPDTGIVLLASDDSSRRYYHVELPVSPVG